jgi:4-hydroxybenzoate polyprenyltransferase
LIKYSFLDAIFVTRPIILVPVWGYFLIGYYSAIKESLTAPFLFSISNSGWISLALITMAVASTYILNQIVDIKTDSQNDGLPLIAKGRFPIETAKIECLILGIAPLVISPFISKELFFLILSATILNITYNLKPFYFTGRPFLDFLSNAIGFGFVAFGLGWFSALNFKTTLSTDIIKNALPYFLFMAAGSINSTIPDIKGDKSTGKITTVVLLGEKWSNVLSLLFLFVALGFSANNHDKLAIVTAIFCIPVFARYQITGNYKHALQTFQIGGGLLMILIAVIVPAFFVTGIIIYLCTRLYFKKRHGFKYP